MPPQPGTMPSITSGSTRRVPGSSTTTRYLHASASSSPPPRQNPRTSASVGYGAAASSLNMSQPRLTIATASSTVLTRSNSSMSAPAMNPPSLPERMTSPLGGAAARLLKAERNSARTSADSELIGAPTLSRVSHARPSPSVSSFQCLAVAVAPVAVLLPAIAIYAASTSIAPT